MKFCQRKDFIDRQSYVAQYISLALLTVGIMTMLGSDDLLAAFSCGAAFAWDGFFNRQTEESVFSSVIDLMFNVAAFVYVGAWMPFDSFSNESLSLSVWRLIVIAILVLTLKRLPIMIALYRFIPDVKTFREAIFSGHFGPIGIGAYPLISDASFVTYIHFRGYLYLHIGSAAAPGAQQPSSPPV
jgi:NhaP-type Na+/H+ or K+/H+ antiporter